MTREVTGEITYRIAWGPIRALEIVTGLVLVRGLLGLIARFLLGFRRLATVRIRQGAVELKSETRLFGREIRRAQALTPIKDVRAVQLESRSRFLYMLFGFGFLAVGVFAGMHWFVDGLRAGYPYLMLLGAGILLAGIVVDLVVFLFVPKAAGKSRLVLLVGPWVVRVAGVDEKDATQLVDAVAAGIEEGS